MPQRLSDPSVTARVCAEFWRAALAAEVGIAIDTDNPREITRHLYETKPADAGIRVCQVGESELWLVKETVEVII